MADDLVEKRLDKLLEESGDRNIVNYNWGKLTPEGLKQTANGYWQITDTNWNTYAPKVGIDLKESPYAMAADKDDQRKVARYLLTQTPLGPKNWVMYTGNDKFRKEFDALGGDVAQDTDQMPDFKTKEDVRNFVKQHPDQYPDMYKQFFPEAAKPTAPSKTVPTAAPTDAKMTANVPGIFQTKVNPPGPAALYNYLGDIGKSAAGAYREIGKGFSDDNRTFQSRAADIEHGLIQLGTPVATAAFLAANPEMLPAKMVQMFAGSAVGAPVLGGLSSSVTGLFTGDKDWQRLAGQTGEVAGGVLGGLAGPKTWGMIKDSPQMMAQFFKNPAVQSALLFGGFSAMGRPGLGFEAASARMGYEIPGIKSGIRKLFGKAPEGTVTDPKVDIKTINQLYTDGAVTAERAEQLYKGDKITPEEYRKGAEAAKIREAREKQADIDRSETIRKEGIQRQDTIRREDLTRRVMERQQAKAEKAEADLKKEQSATKERSAPVKLVPSPSYAGEPMTGTNQQLNVGGLNVNVPSPVRAVPNLPPIPQGPVPSSTPIGQQLTPPLPPVEALPAQPNLMPFNAPVSDPNAPKLPAAAQPGTVPTRTPIKLDLTRDEIVEQNAKEIANKSKAKDKTLPKSNSPMSRKKTKASLDLDFLPTKDEMARAIELYEDRERALRPTANIPS